MFKNFKKKIKTRIYYNYYNIGHSGSFLKSGLGVVQGC